MTLVKVITKSGIVVKISGSYITIPGWENYKFIIHKKLIGYNYVKETLVLNNDMYTISEAGTGLSFDIYCGSKKETLHKVYEKLKTIKKKVFKDLIHKNKKRIKLQEPYIKFPLN